MNRQAISVLMRQGYFTVKAKLIFAISFEERVSLFFSLQMFGEHGLFPMYQMRDRLLKEDYKGTIQFPVDGDFLILPSRVFLGVMSNVKSRYLGDFLSSHGWELVGQDDGEGNVACLDEDRYVAYHSNERKKKSSKLHLGYIPSLKKTMVVSECLGSISKPVALKGIEPIPTPVAKRLQVFDNTSGMVPDNACCLYLNSKGEVSPEGRYQTFVTDRQMTIHLGDTCENISIVSNVSSDITLTGMFDRLILIGGIELKMEDKQDEDGVLDYEHEMFSCSHLPKEIDLTHVKEEDDVHDITRSLCEYFVTRATSHEEYRRKSILQRSGLGGWEGGMQTVYGLSKEMSGMEENDEFEDRFGGDPYIDGKPVTHMEAAWHMIEILQNSIRKAKELEDTIPHKKHDEDQVFENCFQAFLFPKKVNREEIKSLMKKCIEKL